MKFQYLSLHSKAVLSFFPFISISKLMVTIKLNHFWKYKCWKSQNVNRVPRWGQWQITQSRHHHQQITQILSQHFHRFYFRWTFNPTHPPLLFSAKNWRKELKGYLVSWGQFADHKWYALNPKYQYLVTKHVFFLFYIVSRPSSVEYLQMTSACFEKGMGLRVSQVEQVTYS